MWKIQRTESKGRYIYAVVPDHPKADAKGRVLLHRVLMENHLGRMLEDAEVVHHKNKDSKDNHIENLEVMAHGDHTKLHHPATILDVECAQCGKKFTRAKRSIRGERVFCSKSCSTAFYLTRRKKKPVAHGTSAGYDRGCRCIDCKRGHADSLRRWRHGLRA